MGVQEELLDHFDVRCECKSGVTQIETPGIPWESSAFYISEDTLTVLCLMLCKNNLNYVDPTP